MLLVIFGFYCSNRTDYGRLYYAEIHNQDLIGEKPGKALVKRYVQACVYRNQKNVYLLTSRTLLKNLAGF
jgi:hypothetical protein